MVHHKLIDMLVFALLDFMDFNLHAKTKLFLEICHLLLILLQKLFLLNFEPISSVFELTFELFLTRFNICNVAHIVSGVIVLASYLIFALFSFICLMVVKLCALISFSILSYSVEGLLVLIFKMLDFLLISDHTNVVLVLSVFHFCVVVPDLRFKLFYILPRVVIKVMDHVFFYLKHVALDLSFVKLLLQVLNSNFELGTHHCHVMIFRFNIEGSSLLALLSLSFLSFSSHFEFL